MISPLDIIEVHVASQCVTSFSCLSFICLWGILLCFLFLC